MQSIIQLVRNPLCAEYTSDRIVQLLQKSDLNKLQRMMKTKPKLNLLEFLRTFRRLLLPHTDISNPIFITYGILKLYKEIAEGAKTQEITFSEISTVINDKMPISDQEVRVKEKIYPTSLTLPTAVKKLINTPDVIGKVEDHKQRLEERPYLSDRFNHLHRRVGHTEYSQKNNLFITMDCSSCEITLLNSQLQLNRTLKTELDLSKRDSFITSLAWSQYEERVACILNNYSISVWSMEDNFRYEVNVPLPLQLLLHPYVEIKYSETNQQWYALDNRPVIYFLRGSDFLPAHIYQNPKIKKQKQTQKVLVIQLNYKKMLCLGFQKNIFLISFEKKQLVGSLYAFKTSISSICFSNTYQALFISNFQNTFTCYQLSQYDDLSYKGTFQGHKHRICLLMTPQPHPIVCSLQQTALLKLWDIRDFTCYQSFSTLRNIRYEQMITLPHALCLVGSKIYLYKWHQNTPKPQHTINLHAVNKNIILTTNLTVRIYSSGTLKKVIKGIFPHDIYSVYPCEQMLLLSDEEGNVKVYDIRDLTLRTTLKVGVRPFYMHYQDNIISICGWDTLSLHLHQPLTLKRTITNLQQPFCYCNVAPRHDLILLKTTNDSNLYFYSYERVKLIGYTHIEQFVDACFVRGKAMVFILTKSLLHCYCFETQHNTLSLKAVKSVHLWEGQPLSHSTKLTLYSPINPTLKHKLIITSHSLVLSLSFYLDHLHPHHIKIHSQNYNAMRSASQYHSAPKSNGQTKIIDDFIPENIFRVSTVCNHKDHVDSTLVGQYFAIADDTTINVYSLHGSLEGVININDPIPMVWNIVNHSQEQLEQLKYVVQFIENQQKYENEIRQMVSNHTHKTAQSNVEIERNIKGEYMEFISWLTIGEKQTEKQPKSHSLREKKRIIEKEREERAREEKYYEQNKAIEHIKLKGANLKINQKYVNQSLAFLSVNRNNNLLKKGIVKEQMQSMKVLSRKLDMVINKDQKKSIVSKISYGEKPKLQITVKEQKDQPAPTPSKMIETESLRDKLRRLDDQLKRSKQLQRKRAKGSLPNLRRD